MLDADIRAALRRDIVAAHAGARVLNELGLRRGGVRVDVAVVSDALTGYEIKSPADTLRRLPRQVEAYGQVLDRAAIVLADEHHDAALAIVPAWWAVLVATEDDDGVRCEVARAGAPNPSINARALAELLWHAQTIELLRARGATRGVLGRSRDVAWDRLVEVCTLDEIRAAVRAHLMTARIGGSDA